MQNDQELMLKVAKGDLDAFREIVLLHQQSAWRVAYHFLGDASEAEDVAQEAFLKILAAAPRYRPSAAFRTYLYRVVSRLCFDRARKMKPVYTDAPPDVPDGAPSPGAGALADERGDIVRRAVDALPPAQRMAVVLRYYEELDYRDVASALGITEKAVERLLARGRAILAARLEGLSSQE